MKMNMSLTFLEVDGIGLMLDDSLGASLVGVEVILSLLAVAMSWQLSAGPTWATSSSTFSKSSSPVGKVGSSASCKENIYLDSYS